MMKKGYKQKILLSARSLRLIESDISNHHASHLLVQSANQDGAIHGKICSQCRIHHFHKQRLVLDEFLTAIGCDRCPNHSLPTINQTPLQQRRLQSWFLRNSGNSSAIDLTFCLNIRYPPKNTLSKTHTLLNKRYSKHTQFLHYSPQKSENRHSVDGESDPDDPYSYP